MAGHRPAPIDQLRAIVSDEHVLVDRDLLAGHEVDWTGRFRGRAACLVRPADTAQVAAVVGLLAGAGVPIVPQGGNTGLVGGGVPRDGEVVLSTTRLRAIDPPDLAAGQVTAGAGATLAEVQAVAATHGLRLPVDLGARDTATVGGMAATNAGGVNAVRFGSMRAQVAGLEAVTASGAVVSRLGGLLKDNAGYDLTDLLVGSEGTLGVITRLRLRLRPAAPRRAAALLGLDGIPAAVAAAGELLAALPSVEAAELMLDSGMRLACEHLRRPLPLPAEHRAYLLVEAAGREPQEEALAVAVAGLDGVEDAVVAEDSAGRDRLWALREGHSVAVAATGVPPHKLDVTLPLARLAEFVERCDAAIARLDPQARVYTYGHVGDGNLHVNVLGPAPDDDRVDDTVLELVAEMGGSISAEHGIGVAKAGHLHLGRSAAEIEAMWSIKRALDPAGLLNPGVVLAGVSP